MRARFKQGIYTPRNPKKYVGKPPIIYRSKLEKTFFDWLDKNTKVLDWTSESVVIPYIHPKDGKYHRYFVDCTCTILNDKNVPEKFLIEVKPSKQTQPPSKRLKPKNYLYESYQFKINYSKWHYAKEWADKNGYKFIIVTENFFKN